MAMTQTLISELEAQLDRSWRQMLDHLCEHRGLGPLQELAAGTRHDLEAELRQAVEGWAEADMDNPSGLHAITPLQALLADHCALRDELYNLLGKSG